MASSVVTKLPHVPFEPCNFAVAPGLIIIINGQPCGDRGMHLTQLAPTCSGAGPWMKTIPGRCSSWSAVSHLTRYVASLIQLRWPEGFICPRCGGRSSWRMKRGLVLCASCRYQASVTGGTIFQDSRIPLTTWFRSMWKTTSQEYGVSALGLQRALGLGSYRTSWTMLHKTAPCNRPPGLRSLAWCRGGRRCQLGRTRRRCRRPPN
jgi:hypothetical protein